jgi:hypothetical protein
VGELRGRWRRGACRVFGHRLPRWKRPFFLTERVRRCERCGERVLVRDS